MTERVSRSSQEREKVWAPPSNLDVPEPPEGYSYRWVRAENRGQEDEMNVIKRIRQHYEPVRADELPGYLSPKVETGKHAGVVRSGDLILCKVPVEVREQRDNYYREQTRKLQAAVDRQLKKDVEPYAPLINESNSVTKRGRKKAAHFNEE